MQRPAKYHLLNEEDSVEIDDDGELQGLVFCLHCHTVNSADATHCESCKNPLLEPPSDLRDRLERIRQHGSQREDEELFDAAIQRLDQTVSGMGTALTRPFRVTANLLAAAFIVWWTLIGGLLRPAGRVMFALLWPFRWMAHRVHLSSEQTLSPSPHRRPLKYAVNILQKTRHADHNPFPAHAQEYGGWRELGSHDKTGHWFSRLRDYLDDLFQGHFILVVWTIVVIFVIVDIFLFVALFH